MKKFALAAGAVALAASGLTACGSSTKTLTVLAASSLKPVFTQLKTQFEKEHPGMRVVFQFGGSSDLAADVNAGQSADVFASADVKNMGKVGSAAVSPTKFATNVLEIATPPGNRKHVRSFADLAHVTLVECAAEVPCGSAADKLATILGVRLKPASREQSVADVLGKVEAGQADAGVVYVTDVKAAGKAVTGVPIPGADRSINTYEIASLKNSPESALAADWVTLVTGPNGQAALRAAGFGKP